jgi:hypothetical protein
MDIPRSSSWNQAVGKFCRAVGRPFRFQSVLDHWQSWIGHIYSDEVSSTITLSLCINFKDARHTSPLLLSQLLGYNVGNSFLCLAAEFGLLHYVEALRPSRFSMLFCSRSSGYSLFTLSSKCPYHNVRYAFQPHKTNTKLMAPVNLRPPNRPQIRL